MKHKKVPVYLSLLLFLLLLSISSCKTTATPIIYDETIKKIKKEIEVITLMIQANQLDDAETRLNKNLSLYTQNPDLFTLKCFLLLKQNRLNEAKKWINEALTLTPGNPLLYTASAEIAIAEGEYESAEKLFEKSLKLSPYLSYTWYRKGLLEFQQNDYSNALISFQKAYQSDPKNRQAYFFRYLSKLYTTKNLDAHKEEWFEIKKNLLTVDSYYYTFHAKALYDIHYFQDAQILLKEGLEKYPNDPYLLNLKIVMQLEEYRKNPEASSVSLIQIEKDILQVLETLLIPETLDTYFHYLILSGQTEQLKSEYKIYILQFPNSPLIHYWGTKLKELDLENDS